MPEDPVQQDPERLRKRMAEDGKRFRKALSAHNVKTEWRSAIGWPIDFVMREARAADLIVSLDAVRPSLWAAPTPARWS